MLSPPSVSDRYPHTANPNGIPLRRRRGDESLILSSFGVPTPMGVGRVPSRGKPQRGSIPQPRVARPLRYPGLTAQKHIFWTSLSGRARFLFPGFFISPYQHLSVGDEVTSLQHCPRHRSGVSAERRICKSLSSILSLIRIHPRQGRGSVAAKKST
jgi:hypothetical protein